jgi:hypothetical protein
MSEGFNFELTTQSRRVMDEDDIEFQKSCRHGMDNLEAGWCAEGKIFAWDSAEPDYDYGYPCWSWLPDPRNPCKRIFRFRMIGGGQLTFTEQWKYMNWFDGGERPQQSFKPSLLATVETDQGVSRFRGIAEACSYEMAALAAVFPKGTPQVVADRAVKTIRATSFIEEDFMALLDGRQGCAVCHKPLADEVSKIIGIGPTCAKQAGLPHNLDIASKVLQRRRELLGEAS